MAINALAKDTLTALVVGFPGSTDVVINDVQALLNPGNSSFDSSYTENDLRIFLDTGLNSGATVISGKMDSKSRDLINYDENDLFCVNALDVCISYWVTGEAVPNNAQAYEDYRTKVTGFTSISHSEVRAHFWNNKKYLDTGTIQLLASFISTRVAIWTAYQRTDNNNALSLDANDIINLTSNEEAAVSETAITFNQDGGATATSLDAAGTENLRLILEKFYSKTNLIGEPVSVFANKVGNQVSNFDEKAFFRTFSKVDQALYNSPDSGGLTRENLVSLFSKMEEIGLIKLAGYAGSISLFGKKRTASLATVKRSADDFVIDTVDTPWLVLLGEVFSNLRRNPILFANLVYYFPSLITFVMDAVAVTGDYSNDGKGGGAEDRINDEQTLFILILTKE